MIPYGMRHNNYDGISCLLVIFLLIITPLACSLGSGGGDTGHPYIPGLLEKQCGNDYTISGTTRVTNVAWCAVQGTGVMCVMPDNRELNFLNVTSLEQTKKQNGSCR